MMMNKPAEVPSLDAIAKDLIRADQLPSEVRKLLWLESVTLEKVLFLSLIKSSSRSEPSVEAGSERFLTVDEVIEQYHVSRKWLYRHRKTMPHSKPSRKVLLFPADRLRKWFLTHRGVG